MSPQRAPSFDVSGPVAQFNIARMRWGRQDPRMSGFVHNIDRLNLLAERSPGFLWREIEEPELFPGDPRMTWTLTAWETADALSDFAFRTVHARFHARRREWFEEPGEAFMVLWRITPDQWPTPEEALEKLERLRREGPSEHAFGWESLPEVRKARKVSPEVALVGTGAGGATEEPSEEVEAPGVPRGRSGSGGAPGDLHLH
ncbi:DUF3291 domain-containing protein [Albimonas sp. CAU 1670]|uniref:DUF3291 domain-containing protein n=1 Tax=Albimonas sp. CAU 1670 TaxID=3032599 RepID=UPI0023DB41A5|nr:DUF3291 domain-containing protein [Albimonas sp. CAU 1670]MDF2233213.1 DUF3291 domain-containing protein [Albimonas sp. CAU 1670]